VWEAPKRTTWLVWQNMSRPSFNMSDTCGHARFGDDHLFLYARRTHFLECEHTPDLASPSADGQGVELAIGGAAEQQRRHLVQGQHQVQPTLTH